MLKMWASRNWSKARESPLTPAWLFETVASGTRAGLKK
jgi:hypothetical protein